VRPRPARLRRMKCEDGLEAVSVIGNRVMGRLLERERLQVERPPGRPLRVARLLLVNLLAETAWRCWDLAEALRRRA